MKERDYSLDVLRVLACLLVIWQHASEFYYIADGQYTVQAASTYTIGWINSLSRLCVPLFVVISGYFLLPTPDTTSTFFRKRFTRVLWPFLFWCVAYAVYYVLYADQSWADCLRHIASIPVNWGVGVGHLWYVYMLIGLYLLVPILSPWLRQCSKRELQGYLALWVVASLVIYVHEIFPAVLGECGWNASPLLYYYTGFAGYLVLGHYLRRYGTPALLPSVVLLVAGYLISVWGFNSRIATCRMALPLELFWDFCSVNVAMMTLGIFGLVKHLNLTGRGWMGKVVTTTSVISYGIYLAHIMVLNFYHGLFDPLWNEVWIKVPVIALATFFTTIVVVWLLSHLPKARIWLGA